MSSTLLAALVGAIVATFTTLIIVYKADTTIYDRLDTLYLSLSETKEQVNADLVEHNTRLNRHRNKLTNDYKRLDNLHDRVTKLERLQADGDRLAELDTESPLAKSIARDTAEVRARYHPKKDNHL